MPIFDMDRMGHFPPVHYATENGIIGIGGALTTERLIEAYSRGIFPWYSKGEPVIWWSPDPRMVLIPEKLKIHKSMRNILNRKIFTVTADTAFYKVIEACRDIYRPGQQGTWITEEMLRAYQKLHDLGVAHSVEIWQKEKLVGGLYGVALGRAFFGESMFSKVNNASKVGFISLVHFLKEKGFLIIDCQIYTPHLESLGASLVPRNLFLSKLSRAIKQKSLDGRWAVKHP